MNSTSVDHCLQNNDYRFALPAIPLIAERSAVAQEASSEQLLHTAERLIAQRVRWTVRRLARGVRDGDDIAQDLRLEILRRAAEFDPAKMHIEAFLRNVLQGRACKLIRESLAKKRQAAVMEEHDFSLAVHGSQRAFRGIGSSCPLHLLELKLDVQAVVRSLPPRLHSVAVAIMNTPDLTSAARELEISRSTLIRYKRELAQWFVRAQLHE